MKKTTKEDPELINPIYFGTQNMKLGEGKSGAGVKLGQNYKKYKKKKYAWIETEEQVGAVRSERRQRGAKRRVE